MRLDGRSAVVVGGATGWGRASSARLAAEGAHVVVVDGEKDAVAGICEEIRTAGNSCEGHVCEADDAVGLDEIAQGLPDARRSGGPVLDVVVNNHMRLDWASVEDCAVSEFEQTVRNNLVGPVLASKAFLPLLKRAGKGSILHLGSVDGLFGNARAPAYSAAKGGLVSLTHVMAAEFAKYDIRVNAVASAQTNQVERGLGAGQEPVASWEQFRLPDAGYARQLAQATPLKRYGTAQQWAGPVAFLASDDADYVTGAVLVVDCGRTGLTPGTQ